MKNAIVMVLLAAAFGLPRSVSAEEKVYRCRRLSREPVLDGRVAGDRAWEGVSAAASFVRVGDHAPASKKTTFRMGYTPQALYIAVECEEPETSKITATRGDGDIGICFDDGVEVFLFPEGAESYYQFMVSAVGSRWNGIGLGRPYFPLWKWRARTRRGEAGYSVEIRLPFEVFLTIPGKGEKWTGNVCRNTLTSGDRHTTWAHLTYGFHEPYDFGSIVFADAIRPREGRTTRRRIVKLLRGKIAAHVASVAEYRKTFAARAEDDTPLGKEIAAFLEDCEEIRKDARECDSVNEANILHRKSRKLPPRAQALKGRVLLEALFDQAAERTKGSGDDRHARARNGGMGRGELRAGPAGGEPAQDLGAEHGAEPLGMR